jgi:hypothetical protein
MSMSIQPRPEILIDALAKADALFAPTRRGNRAAIAERRAAYPHRGIPWASRGTSEAARKAAQRDLEALRLAGRVKVYKSRGRAIGIALTEAAEDDCRRRCGLATFGDVLGLVDELARRVEDPDGADWGGWAWTPETALAGCEWGDKENAWRLAILADDVAPLLLRGLVASNSSAQGHTWYRLTRRGMTLAAERVADGLAVPFEHADPPAGEPEALDFYRACHRDELARLRTAQADAMGEIGPVPLPVAMPTRRMILKRDLHN